MHELSVTEEILRIATEHAERAGAQRVTTIHLVVGQVTGFVPDSIQFYFDLLAPGSIAEGARLALETVQARFRCRHCEQEFEPAELDWHCPTCGAVAGEVIAGKEFYVESIEVER